MNFFLRRRTVQHVSILIRRKNWKGRDQGNNVKKISRTKSLRRKIIVVSCGI